MFTAREYAARLSRDDGGDGSASGPEPVRDPALTIGLFTGNRI